MSCPIVSLSCGQRLFALLGGRLVTIALLGGAFGAGFLSGQEKDPNLKKRPVTIADAITMTRIAGTGYPGVRPKSGFAVFSPDRKHFVFVTSKGNLRKNTNEYSLLLFRTVDIFHAPILRVLASFSSSSNREGIVDLKWSNDNDTLFFLGSRGDEAAQLYSIQCSSGKMKRLTNHGSSLISYDVCEKRGKLVYAAEKPEISLINDKAMRCGIDITRQNLSDLIRGKAWDYEAEIFMKGSGGAPPTMMHTLDPFDSGINDLYFSPDGRYLVVKTDTKELPESWRQYEDPSIQAVLRRELPKGFPTRILRYELIDTDAARSEVLLDSPATYSPADVLWSPDSKSLLLCGVFLPLNVEDPVELESRRSSKFLVEISLTTPNRTVTKITSEDLRPLQWDAQTNTVSLRAQPNQGQAGSAAQTVYYRKKGTSWERVKVDLPTSNDSRPEIEAEQDLNVPPRIIAIDPLTKQKNTLLDLNPQFGRLAFGKVEEISWKDAKGRPVSGGLYLPPSFVSGTRYPLVIETHGFRPHTFVMDGPHMTASAGQPLASRGIIVLQVNDIFSDSLVTPEEPERAMRAYESAIELLDQKGMIDRDRIGLMGFSRTCMYVKYTLTHSRQHFAAAISADGVDAGYLQYMLFLTANPYGGSEFETIIGAPPFGDGLLRWFDRSPGFRLDKVQTPLLIQALGPSSILSEWEWFAGLKRLGKPVDLLYLPNGTHILVAPWDRLASQGGALDWFCFWLTDQEDPDPAKRERYRRWRELRAQFEKTAPSN